MRIFYTGICLILWAELAVAAAKTSPYIEMHKKDLVEWQSYSAESFARAKKQDKLIFVSIGYFSCYWCHVLQKESFQNQKIAAFLNKKMVNIIVDRELNPQFDRYMLNFLKQINGRGGWPLNVILTPDGYPLTGFVYLPKDKLLQVLNSIHSEWQQDRHKLEASARSFAQEQQSKTVKKISSADKLALRKGLLKKLRTQLDEFEGGIGQQAKFPHTPLLKSLLCADLPELEEWLQLTLDRMANGGLRDHINGGFFRYTSEPDWKQPHFEKMLYDNSLLAELYFIAAKRFPGKNYAEVALDTLSFLQRDLMDKKDGLFFSSVSAIDHKGVEGSAYLYTEAELKQIFSVSQIPKVQGIWQLDDNQHDAGALPIALTNQRNNKFFQFSKQKFRRYYLHHAMPVDEKKITAWNALSLNAFVRAYRHSKNRKFLQRAKVLARHLHSQWRGQSLYRTKGQQVPASLEDYAYVLHSLQNYLQIKSDAEYSSTIVKISDKVWRQWDHSGWQDQHSFLPYLKKVAILPDSMLPSPTALLIQMGIAQKNSKAEFALHSGVDQLRSNELPHATLIMSLNASSPEACLLN